MTDRQVLILQLYQQGRFPEEIARELGYKQGSSVIEFLKRQGKYDLSRRGNGKRGNKNSKRYVVNENYFEVVDTEEKAYWLGFLFADGYNTEAYRITINLQWSDRDHLERLKLSLDSTHPVLYRQVKIKKLNDVARLDVNSYKLCKDLKSHGMVRAKSLILDWPINLPLELTRHFLRGYFDGDGCISNSKTAGAVFSICSSEILSQKIKDYLVVNLKLRNNQLDKAGRAKVIRWSGLEPVEKIYHLFYDGAAIYLPRKKERFESLLGLSTLVSERKLLTNEDFPVN